MMRIEWSRETWEAILSILHSLSRGVSGMGSSARPPTCHEWRELYDALKADLVRAEEPKLADLKGIAPDMTGGVESAEFVRRNRDGQDEAAAEADCQPLVVDYDACPHIVLTTYNGMPEGVCGLQSTLNPAPGGAIVKRPCPKAHGAAQRDCPIRKLAAERDEWREKHAAECYKRQAEIEQEAWRERGMREEIAALKQRIEAAQKEREEQRQRAELAERQRNLAFERETAMIEQAEDARVRAEAAEAELERLKAQPVLRPPKHPFPGCTHGGDWAQHLRRIADDMEAGPWPVSVDAPPLRCLATAFERAAKGEAVVVTRDDFVRYRGGHNPEATIRGELIPQEWFARPGECVEGGDVLDADA